MTSLPDAERDACDVMQALAGLAALLRRPSADLPSSDLPSSDLLGLNLPGSDSLSSDSLGADSIGADLIGADLLGLDPGDPAIADTRRLLLSLAEDGGVAAARVVAYLREQRGAGDGELAAVPPHLGQWRHWVPPRGHLFGVPDDVRRPGNEVPHPRRSDPGE